MKKILLTLLLLTTSFAEAGVTTILDEAVPGLGNAFTTVDTRFHMDQTTGQGFVKVLVQEQHDIFTPHCTPHTGCFPRRIPRWVTVFSKTVQVDGLMLMDKKVMYQAPEGEVQCGTMGLSRVFRIPTIFLNGNCRLNGMVEGRFRNSRVLVNLRTLP